MITIQAPEDIKLFLVNNGFKINGYDFYKSFVLTDFVNEWEEEIYVSLTNAGYEIYYPDSKSKNKTYKRKNGLKTYINKFHY